MNVRRAALIVPLVAALVTTAPEVSQIAGEAKAGHRRSKPYCKARNKPRGCIPVPKRARRPATTGQQDPPTVAPKGYVNGGGVGGGEDTRGVGAVQWASGFTGGHAWAYRSERFVEEAYAERRRFASPRVARRHLKLRSGSPKLAPPGALMLFAADRFNRGLGHIGLSIGGGRMISALDTVTVTDIAGSPYWNHIYQGWAPAPPGWRGRLPRPPGLEPFGLDTVEIRAPAIGAVLAATTRLEASVALGNVAFAAFYSDDPASAVTPVWHYIGAAVAAGGGIHVLDWDTTTVRDQGSRTLGTVTISAFVVDDGGAARGIGAYRRVSVRNAVP